MGSLALCPESWDGWRVKQQRLLATGNGMLLYWACPSLVSYVTAHLASAIKSWCSEVIV